MRLGETANDAAREFGKPLDGVRVLAVGQMQSLPYATQLLARRTTLPTPYRDRPAYAPIVEAMAGLYDFRHHPDRPPLASPLGVLGDTATALFAAIGILAALRHRDATGLGQHVDIAMLDSMIALADAGINYLSLGITSGNETPGINDTFAASDGYFIMQCGRRHMFEALANLIGTPEWLTDPDLATAVHWRARLEDRIRPAVEAWAASRTRAEACAALGDAGIAAGPVRSAAEVIADEHTAAHGMVVEIDRPRGDGPPVLTVGNPVKLSRMTEGPETRMPWLGEHTDAVLRDELGLDDAAIAALRADDVIA